MKTVTLELPDELAELLTEPGQDLGRTTLEALAVEACRAHRITEHQFAKLLGIDRYEADGVLKRHQVWLDYTIEDFRREGEFTRQFIERNRQENPAPSSKG